MVCPRETIHTKSDLISFSKLEIHICMVGVAIWDQILKMSNLSNDIEISSAGQIRDQRVDHGRAEERRSRSPVSRFRCRLHTFNVPTDTSTDHYIVQSVQPPLSSHSPIMRKRSSTYAFGATLDDSPQQEFTDDNRQTAHRNKVVMAGWLYKTTRPKTSKTRGHRQHRQFRLTAHSLEYDQFFQKVAT